MKNTNVQVIKHIKENSMGLIKRFQKKVQESGVLPKVRSKRYATRKLSQLKVKKNKVIKLESKTKYDILKRMGKLTVKLSKKKL